MQLIHETPWICFIDFSMKLKLIISWLFHFPVKLISPWKFDRRHMVRWMLIQLLRLRVKELGQDYTVAEDQI